MNFKYEKYKNGIEITACENTEENIVIPQQIDGQKVIKIGSQVFKRNKIKTVLLPEGIEEIGKKAFSLSSVKEINFPESLKIIEESAFDSCSSLEKAFLGQNTQYIGSKAFSWCTALSEV